MTRRPRAALPALPAWLALAGAAALLLPGCGSPSRSAPAAGSSAAAAPAAPAPVAAIPLPGGGPDGVLMDYLLFDPRTNAVWAPAGNTGAVDVIDAASGRVSQITGFATRVIERAGRRRVVGPSAATLGPPGTVFIGSRGDSSICAIDERTLARRACRVLDAVPDGVSYVAATGEVWITTPGARALRVLDAATLEERARIALDGEPEGYAPDGARGRFYTNLEDRDVTLAIDLATRRPVATWHPGCGPEGPRGLVLAEAEGVLVVACTTSVVTLDVARGGAVVGALDAGAGVDNVDYAPATHLVYAGAARAARLTIARLDARGALTPVAAIPTQEGARNGVVAADGRVYLARSAGSELLVVTPPRGSP